MSDTTNLSEAKRALLEKLLRGNLSQVEKDANTDAITRHILNGPIPLSFRQKEFWIVDQLTPHSPSYNEGVHIYLPGPIDVAAIEQSLNEIIRRHEILRTSFPVVDGQPVQRIHPPSALPLPVADLRHLPETEREAEAKRLGMELIHQPFDIVKAPPLRALLVHLSDQEHRLFLIFHHIITDGFSANQVILPELHALYQAFSSGQPSPLPELPIQYSDYTLWQQERMQGQKLEQDVSFWKQRLADAPDDLALPTDHPRLSVFNGPEAMESFDLPAHISDSLTVLLKQESATLFMTMLAAFGTLLYRYTGQEDIIVGATTSGRIRPELQQLIGAFINFVGMRIDLSGNPSFRELLRRVREVTFATLPHEDLPFEHVVRQLHSEQAVGLNPLDNPFFRVLLTLEPPVNASPSGWSIQQMQFQRELAWYDLAIFLEEHPEGLAGVIKYRSDLFDAATIQRLIVHWQMLLENLATDPDQPIATLPLLTEAERQQVLMDWNATQADYPRDQCVHHLVEAQAARTPDAVAVVYEGAHLTYRQLNERANQVAHHLRKLGVGPDVLVGLSFERSLEMVVGLLGTLKAGGAYVPLDPNYPIERLAFMLEDTHVSVLLTQQHLLARLPQHSARAICLDTDQAAIVNEPTINVTLQVTPDNLAYVIYTSGSTGKPKGVMTNHSSLVNAYYAWEQAYQLRTKSSCYLQMAGFSFDVFTGDLLRALGSGGRLVICPQDFLLDAERLYALLRREHVDGAEFVPVILKNLVQYLKKTDQSLDFMRLLVVGSDTWSAKDHQDVLSLCGPETRFINSYGVTEASIDSTYFEQRDASVPLEAGVPIGRPFANMQIYLLDRHLQPVPVGVSGELYIGGTGLARGYLNRPDLTAERFIPNPFSAEPNARLYKTGDLVRWRADGNLEFVGRTDHQVKLRGFRIELGEIEAALLQHEAVREAVVLAREDKPGEKRLVAYIVSKNDEAPPASLLRNFLKERLPVYMIPATFIFLKSLPITPNGKIDRRALPVPEDSDVRADEDFVAPQTDTEEQLAALWAELLGLKRVSIHDNFFELGGHSLLAVRVLARIQEGFGVELLLPSLFEAPTIAGLAVKIVQKQAEQIDDELTAQLLDELEQLSDAEAQSMIAIGKEGSERMAQSE